MTSFALEQEKQRRWVPEPQFRSLTIWNDLLENEFRPVAEQYAWQCRALRAIVRHNPVVHLTDASRGLMHGTEVMSEVIWVLAASATIVALSAPIALYLYHQER